MQTPRLTLLERLALRDRILKLFKIEGSVFRKRNNNPGQGNGLDNNHNPNDWTY